MSVDLPDFTPGGLLPPGDYIMSLERLANSRLVSGPPSGAWDEEWRAQLVANLASIATTLWELAIEYVVVDGSFVEAKAHPNDIDA